VINEIEKAYQKEVEHIFGATRPHLCQVLAHLENVKSFDIYNGEVLLKNLPINGIERKVIVIDNEQNVDFLIVLDDAYTDFYGFEHFYDETGSDRSRIKEIVDGEITVNHKPFLRCYVDVQGEAVADLAIYNIRDLNYLEVILGSIFCELELDPVDEKELYEIDELVSNPVEKWFKEKMEYLIQLFTTTKDRVEFEYFSMYPLQIKTKDIKSIDEFDAWLDKLLKRVSPPRLESDKEAECYKEALVFELEKQQFVAVATYIANNDRFENNHIDIYCCKENDERFESFENLKNHYTNYKNRKIFEYQYRLDKKSGETDDSSKCSSAIGYFSEIVMFVKLFENMQYKSKKSSVND
jgi:uncharacterized protein YlaI